MKYQPGTFTTTPNVHLLKGKPSELQTIYFWLCQMADDDGVCYPGRRTLSKLTACGLKTIDKYILELVELGILEKRYRPNKPGTKQKQSNMYQILIVNKVDDQKILASIQTDTTPSSQTEPVTKSNKLKPITKFSETDKSAHETEFNFKDYIKTVMESSFIEVNDKKACVTPHRYFAAYFLKRKGLSFNSRQSVEAAMKRHFKAGKELGQFTSDMDAVRRAFDEAENLVYNGQKVNWGLETVLKLLTK
jgi:hypothetical protein